MNPPVFSPDIQEFLRLLARHQVRYVIVGGEAVVYHGHVRLTGDVDIFYDSAPDNAGRLFDALRAFWAGTVPGVASAAELSAPGAVFMFGRPPNRLDLLNRIDGVDFAEAWASRVPVAIRLAEEELAVPYIGLDALIRNKRAAGRPRDQEDLVYLEAVRTRRT
jgi:hypothetical protein